MTRLVIVPLSSEHVRAICRPGTRACCAYLAAYNLPDYFCGKTMPDLRAAIKGRLAAGTMNARGDNCSGPPEFAAPRTA